MLCTNWKDGWSMMCSIGSVDLFIHSILLLQFQIQLLMSKADGIFCMVWTVNHLLGGLREKPAKSITQYFRCRLAFETFKCSSLSTYSVFTLFNARPKRISSVASRWSGPNFISVKSFNSSMYLHFEAITRCSAVFLFSDHSAISFLVFSGQNTSRLILARYFSVGSQYLDNAGSIACFMAFFSTYDNSANANATPVKEQVLLRC